MTADRRIRTGLPTDRKRMASVHREFMIRVWIRLRDMQWTLADIGEVWGLSRQRVHQILVGV